MSFPHLTELLDLRTLRRIETGFAEATRFEAVFLDPSGRRITDDGEASPGVHAVFAEAPVEIDGATLGSLALTGAAVEPSAEDRSTGAGGTGTVGPPVRSQCTWDETVRFLTLLSQTIAELCRQGLQLRRRVDEMSTLYRLSTLLAGERDLDRVLDTVARSVVEVMGVKAASIRLLGSDERELVTAAVHNLSEAYLNKGPVLLENSPIDQEALQGKVAVVEDMPHDSRILYPDDARREGLTSFVCAGMVYRGHPVGSMRIYTAERTTFTEADEQLLMALAQLAAAAIRNVQLDAERRENERIQQQVQLAADVQRRLLPADVPCCPPVELAGRYEPSFELGGDFYDFIPMERSVGIVVGDVVGKGVAASLLMASVRATLRANVQCICNIDRIMSLVNQAMVRDTRPHEFATVFYGSIDQDTLVLTYCSAGHEPGLLLRDGAFHSLWTGGMAVGIDADQPYEQAEIQLRSGDVVVLYSDGMTEATNFDGEQFGRQRVCDAIRAVHEDTAQHIVDHLLWEVRRFAGLQQQTDDTTLVAVKVRSDAAEVGRS